MGVKGLWKLLLPIGRRISIETLAGQTLAIDASIWLTQFLKAMRDPETGKLVRNAHLLGFFRRICRLRFHRIRPIFVFDGATPEIKRAEVQRRKRKRDTFAASLDQSAMQRLAKKLLTEKLRKVKVQQSGKTVNSKNDDVGGFEVGFNPGGSQWKGDGEEDDNDETIEQGRATQNNAVDLVAEDDREVSETSETTTKQAATKQQISDWDLPLQSSSAKEMIDSQEDGDDEHETGRADTSFDADFVSSLATESERKEAVERARKNQRMQSRQEFMPAAANPEDFSSVQMRNFLKYCNLNKDIATMARKVAERRTGTTANTTSASSRVEYIIQHDEDTASESENDALLASSDSQGPAPLLKGMLAQKRNSIKGNGEKNDAKNDDDTSDDESWSVAEHQSPTRSRTRKERLVILDSSDDDDEGTDDLKLPANQNTTVVAQSNATTKDGFKGETEQLPGGFLPSTEPEPDRSVRMKNALVSPVASNDKDSGSNDYALAKILQEEEDEAYANSFKIETDDGATEELSPAECSAEQGIVIGVTATEGTVMGGASAGELVPSESDSDADDIHWEDGSVNSRPTHKHTESHISDMQSFDSFQKHSPTNRSVSRSNGGENTRARETADALKQAETTASNLANWAGRAFRRALKDVHQPAEIVPLSSKEEVKLKCILADEDSDAEIIASEADGQTQKVEAVSEKNRQVEAVSTSMAYESKSAAAVIRPRKLARDVKEGSCRSSIEDEPNRIGNINWDSIRKQQERDTDTISDEMLEESKLLLRLFGIPYVEAPAEAEAQCAALEKLGLVDGVVTEDSDAFVFGAKKVYKHIFDEQKYAEAYYSDDAEKEMKLNQNSMVALAMLLGGDYTEGVKGVGIVNAMELLEAFDVSKDVEVGLTDFRTWLDGFDPFIGPNKVKGDEGATTDRKKERFHEQHKSARSRWVSPGNFPSKEVMKAYLEPVVDQSAEEFTWGTVDETNLIKFCEAYLGWEKDETLKLLKPVLEAQAGGLRQRRIDSYMRYEDSIKFGEINSKRLQKVLKRKDQTQRSKSPDPHG